MDNEFYLKQIRKLSTNGFESFRILQELLNWESNYIFQENTKGRVFWKTNSLQHATNGELYNSMEEAKFSAMIHFCNNNFYTEADSK